MLEKAATIKRFEYSSLGNELEKQTSIAKDWYKFFKDQVNAINNNNRKNNIKRIDIKKQGAETDYVNHSYIGGEYNYQIDNIFIFRLRDWDLHLTEFDNWKLGLTNIDNNYLKKKTLMWMIDCSILRNLLKICWQ